MIFFCLAVYIISQFKKHNETSAVYRRSTVQTDEGKMFISYYIVFILLLFAISQRVPLKYEQRKHGNI